MADYDVGIGLLSGLQRGIGSYFEADSKRQERDLRSKEAKTQGLLQARSAGLIPQYDDDGNIVDYGIDEKMLRLKNPQHGMPQLTKGQEAADVAFGKDYAEYQAGGGRSSLNKNIGLLDSGIDQLKSGKVKTGDWTTKIPLLNSDMAQEIINPEVVAAKDSIRGAIQATLRQTLGSAFTEREGEAVLNRTFNPRLSTEENIKRAEIEIQALKKQAADKESSARHYEQRGTLTGYSPGQGLMAPSSAQAAPQMSPEDQEAMAWANANPQDPRSRAIKQKLGR